MTLDVHLFPCLSDNYGFLVRDRPTGLVACIDSPDADRILEELETLGWGRLDTVLNTHWHPDHTGGNAGLKAATGCQIVGPSELEGRALVDVIVGEGDQVLVGNTVFDVHHTPGHTLGHVVFHAPAESLAFVGDVIFPLGCGRLFEGTPQQMWASLSIIAAWPGDTVLWSAHEYAASNARFALSIDHRPDMVAYAGSIFEARERGEPTVPTTVESERRFNPFLTAANAQEFARRRDAKDGFQG
jgi:hydroxyacylglutathione hydrolase